MIWKIKESMGKGGRKFKREREKEGMVGGGEWGEVNTKTRLLTYMHYKGLYDVTKVCFTSS